MSKLDEYIIKPAEYSWSEACTGSGGYGRWRAIAEHKKTGHIIFGQGSTKEEAEKNVINNINMGRG